MSKDAWVGPWRPHRPRAPISYQFRTPGPKYGLPGSVGYDQHDPSRSRAPAYSFGHRMGSTVEPRSPGPQYLVPTGFTVRGQHRAPAFTMGGRARERRLSSTPGPAHYFPETANRVTLPSAPACSMSSRKRPDRPQQTPGPGTYHLPPVMGPRLLIKKSAPEYSITGRSTSIFQDARRVPGPSNYSPVSTDVYMARAPRCTMAGRGRTPPAAITPGPSDYGPPQETQKQGQTFGVRHSEAVVPIMDSYL